MAYVVLFVNFFVDFFSEPRQNDFLEDSPVKKPDDYDILDDGPTQLGDYVTLIGED
jgi:hypothetical protein